jgi:hypothetical protein
MKIITAFITLFMLGWGSALAQPKLEIDSMTVDLGTIYSGAIKTGTITLRNIGNKPLKILHVQPSCGCTTVRQPKSELQPNESDEVEVSFNSTLYRGPVEKYVNIETNDPLSQYVAVKLVADVREELAPTSSSYSIWLGNVPVGKKIEQSLTFTNHSRRTLTIKGIKSTSAKITAEAEQKKVGPSDTLTVKLTAIPDKVGYDNGGLTILTDSKNQPSVELKIYYIGQKGQ